MFEIRKYTPDDEKQWNELVANSINGTFLFNRDYMDYHSDRFIDYSLMIYRKNNLWALFPANITNNIVYSHQGLTYGGFIINQKTKSAELLEIASLILRQLKSENIVKVIYKPIPYIYHSLPAQSDLYALFIHKARLVAREISSALYLADTEKTQFSTLRKRGIKKAETNHIRVAESDDFSTFWDILNKNLSKKYSVSPVHTLEEIKLLKSRFPKEIKLFVATNKDNKINAGVVIFETKNVIRCQYISANEEGKKHGALDAIFNYLIHKYYYTADKYFDFGQSTTHNGEVLNETLIFQKEGFGARGIVYDTYEINLTTQ